MKVMKHYSETAKQLDQAFLRIDQELTSRKPLAARDKRLLALTRKAATLWEMYQAQQRNDVHDVELLRRIYREELSAR